MPTEFQTVPWGPPSGGVVDTANASDDLTHALRLSQYLKYTGANRYTVSNGIMPQMTLMDDQATAAPVTSVIHVGVFFDGAVALAHSTITQKVYLYVFPADLSGYVAWNGTPQANQIVAYPVYIVWGPGADDHSKTTAVPTQPDVFVTELLGQLFIANTQAQDQNGLYYPTRLWNKAGSSPYTSSSQTALAYLPSLLCNGVNTGNGTDVAYFLGVIAFQQALWGWGYADGASAGFSTGAGSGLAFDPSLLRFSPPFNPQGMQAVDSFTIGNRLRSQRERIIGAGIAGDSLVLGGSYLTAKITGYGRDSYYKTIIDTTFGFIGPKCAVSVGDSLYYWCSRGPIRVSSVQGEPSKPQPMWDKVFGAVQTVANASRVVAGFDADRDQVVWVYDTSQGVRTVMAYDTRRELFRTAGEDLGVTVACAGAIEPIIASTNTTPQGPSANPIQISTTQITPNTALATFEELDPTASTEISLALYTPKVPDGIYPPGYTGYGTFNVVNSVGAPGGTSPTSQTYTFTTLTAGQGYAWRIRGFKNGQYTDYVGPFAGVSVFITPGQSTTTEPAPTNLTAAGISTNTGGNLAVQWHITDALAQTEVWIAPPSLLLALVLSGVGTVNSVATLNVTQAPGLGSVFLTIPNANNAEYGVWVRHVRAGFTASPFTPGVGVNVPNVAGSTTPTGQQAATSDSFVESMGIGTHLNDRRIANDTVSATAILKAIPDIGFRYARDGGNNAQYYADMAALGTAHGTKWSNVLDVTDGFTPTNITTLIPSTAAPYIECYEIMNEPDGHSPGCANSPGHVNRTPPITGGWTYNGQSWPQAVVSYANDMYTALKALPAPYSTTPVTTPSLGFGPGSNATTTVASLNSVGVPFKADWANMHDYPGAPNLPDDQLTTGKNWTASAQGLLGMTGKPIVSTETGYSVATTDASFITQNAQAKYALRIFAERYRFNITNSPTKIVRTHLYNLSPVDSVDFSIMNADGSYRPAATACKNLIQQMGDTNFTPGKLNYTINSTDPKWTASGKSLLFQKQNGNFLVMTWLDVSSCTAGTTTSAAVDISSTANITISFNGTAHQQVNLYQPTFSPAFHILGTNISSLNTNAADEIYLFEVVG